MTALSQSIKRKLSLLQQADELGNIALARKIMGYHRNNFYEVRSAFQVGGIAALVVQRRGAGGPHPNRVNSEIEARVLDQYIMFPTQAHTKATC